ncbi:MAG: molybdopterin-dependent oxidoreductase [Deltaproteobacteria bacterium]|nr:molybdopterin-dependent oxidoreductase [Deltaproteobacteria bacterium]
MKDTVTLIIDGKETAVPKETTILEAAKALGIEIPTLCFHPKLRPIGSCRLCLVEIKGTDKPVTSCNTPVVDGMVVTTQSERLFNLRKEAIRFLLVNHPLDCPVCDKGGECRLQDLAFEFEVDQEAYQIPPSNIPIDYLSPLVERNNNRCIRCGRCVSICNEIQGEMALEWSEHGFKTEILPRGGYPLNCEFCGQCIAICPVGALTNRLFKYRARVWEMEKVPSVCPYCGGGCAIELNVRKNKVLRVTSNYEDTPNQGNLCGRGNFGFGFINNHDRLHTPLVKRRKDHVPVAWDEILGTATEHLKKIISDSGPDSVAGLGSPRVSNEDSFLFQKFFRAGIGTNNVDSPAHFSYRNLERGLGQTIGFPASPNAFEDLEMAQVIFVIGADVRGEMPPAAVQIMKAARFHGSKLFVANPRSTKLDKFSTLSLCYCPGTELLLVAGIMKVIIEKGLEDKEFIEKNVSNFQSVKNSLEGMSVQKIAEFTSIPVDQINILAETLTKPGTGCIVFGHDVFTHAQGKEIVGCLANLALLTGKVGRKHCGLVPVITKNNCQGMLDMGVMPDLLPGYQDFESSASFEKAWGRSIPKKPGKTAEEILTAIEQGKIKALYIMGCDPIVDFPEPDKWKEALEKLEWLAVQDIFYTEAAAKAHYIFPATTFAEKEGTFTNGERRIQKIAAAIDCFRNSLPDWEIIQKLSQRLGYRMNYPRPSAIMDEIASLVPQYKDISSKKLGRKGIQWPLQGEDGSPHIPVNELNLSFSDFTLNEPEKLKSGDFYLLTGTAFFHSGTLSTYAEGLNILGREAWVELNRQDADSLGLNEGDTITISSSQKPINAPVKISSAVPPGVIFIPHHFRDVKVNTLIARQNCCQVEITKG